MTKTAKIVIWVVVIVLVIWGFSSLGGGEKTSVLGETVKVGVILPLSGDFAIIGEELKKGVDLAVEQLQKKNVKISVVYEDDKFDPREAVTAANKLLSVDKIDFGALFSVEEARPIVSIFNKNKVPLVSMWDSNEFLKNSGPYIFSNGFSTEKAGEDMADFSFNTLNLKKVAIMSHVDAWSEIISKSFKDRFEKNGGEIVYNDAVQVGTTDFRLLIQKMKAVNPDGIYFPLIPFDSVSFIQQVNQLGLRLPMMTGDAFLQDVIDAVGGISEGIYFTNSYPEERKLLEDLYREKYKIDSPALGFVAVGFDGIMKIGLALDSSKIIKSTLDEVFGPTRTADRIEKIYQVKSGEPVEIN